MAKILYAAFMNAKDDQIAAYANRVIGLMTTDPQFTSASAEVALLKTACEAYEVAYQENEIGGRPATIVKDDCKVALQAQLKRVALLVEFIANGSELVILAAGFDVAKSPQRYTALNAPLLKVVKDGLAKGTVTLKFDKVDGANNYGIKKRLVIDGVPQDWHNGAFSTASNYRLEGLESDKYYDIAIYAIGRRGLVSPDSNAERVLVS